MKLYVLSDLHAESAAFLADPAALEEADVVVLAGDIHCGEYTPFWARKTFGDKPIVDYRISLYDGGVQAVFDELAHVKAKNRVFMIVGHEPTVSISAQWLASADSDGERLDLLNLGLSPASIVIMGSNKPFDEWQVHSGELLAVINVKDFD